jgi:DMSO/TMAO reductase YedYZ molybdopterin-dependent catalytic subunit
VITPRVFGERGRRRAIRLGLDPDRLPPGQSPTLKLPEFTFNGVPRIDLATWTLEVAGAVEAPYAVTWDELRALEPAEWKGDIHCVTRWSRFDTRWDGVPVRVLLERARPQPEATHLMAHGYDGYSTNVALEALDEALVAWAFDGEPLEQHHGWPARLVVPDRYFWKSAKWVRALELMAGDRPGFWERNGYHMEGDPWKEQRHG